MVLDLWVMKKSAVAWNLIRAIFVVLAYKEIAHPKAAIIPPGTGRTTAHYIKSCWHIARSYLKTIGKRVKHA
jgi:hypothetical protein